MRPPSPSPFAPTVVSLAVVRQASALKPILDLLDLEIGIEVATRFDQPHVPAETAWPEHAA